MLKIKGFTLIELLVVISIISILSSIAIYGLTSVRLKAQDASKIASLREVEIALETYKSVFGKYPDAGPQGGVDYIKGLTPNYIKKLPLDPQQTTSKGFLYKVSGDKKTYCFAVRETFNFPENHGELEDNTHNKSIEVCRGKDAQDMSGGEYGI